MTNRLALISALFTLIFTSTTQGRDTVHKWTDDQGVVHYSDRPAVSGSKTLQVSKSNVLESVMATVPEVQPPKPRRPARSEPSADKRAEHCFKARQRVDSVRAKRRHGYKASEDRGLRQQLARARERVRFYC